VSNTTGRSPTRRRNDVSTSSAPAPHAAALFTLALVFPATNAAAAPSSDAGASKRTVSHDITFIAMLVPHHQMAVDMASVARNKATNP
jgi:uncharacterized protein (DUF305 family)